VVDPKRIIGKNGGPRRRRGTRGRWPKKKNFFTLLTYWHIISNFTSMTFLRQPVIPFPRAICNNNSKNAGKLHIFFCKNPCHWFYILSLNFTSVSSADMQLSPFQEPYVTIILTPSYFPNVTLEGLINFKFKYCP
jgi:hypothetical protein